MNRVDIYAYIQNFIKEKTGNRTFLFSLAITLLSSSLTTNASDEGLYDPKAPAGSAFIRIFDNTSSSSFTAKIGGKTLKSSDSNVSPYQFFPQGDYTLDMNGKSYQLPLEANHYYTAYIKPAGDIGVVEGRKFDQRKKALIAFYNFTETPLALKTVNGKSSVLAPVDASDSGFREVNAVKITLATFNETQKLISAGTVALKRGKVFNLFAFIDSNNQPALTWIQE